MKLIIDTPFFPAFYAANIAMASAFLISRITQDTHRQGGLGFLTMSRSNLWTLVCFAGWGIGMGIPIVSLFIWKWYWVPLYFILPGLIAALITALTIKISGRDKVGHVLCAVAPLLMFLSTAVFISGVVNSSHFAVSQAQASTAQMDTEVYDNCLRENGYGENADSARFNGMGFVVAQTACNALYRAQTEQQKLAAVCVARTSQNFPANEPSRISASRLWKTTKRCYVSQGIPYTYILAACMMKERDQIETQADLARVMSSCHQKVKTVEGIKEGTITRRAE